MKKLQLHRKKKILLIFSPLLIFASSVSADINCSMYVIYDYYDQKIAIIIINEEMGDINYTIQGYSIYNQKTGFLAARGSLAPHMHWEEIDVLEHGDSFILYQDFSANYGDVISVLADCSSSLLFVEVIAGKREADIINFSIILIISSIILIFTFIIIIYFKKIKLNRKLT
jgi:hypothetical protein